MKIISPGFTEIYNSNPQKHIEEIARTCYKSNDLITDDSNKTFIKNLHNRKHWAMLEHYIFIYQANTSFFETIVEETFVHATRTVIEIPHEDGGHRQTLRNIISFSARSILDLLEKYKDDSYIR